MYALLMSLVARSTLGPQILNPSLKYGFKSYLLYFASVLRSYLVILVFVRVEHLGFD